MPTERLGQCERGNSVIEFALVSIIIIPLFFGMIAVGINMGMMVETVQVSRDVGHMYANGVDFSETANQNIAVSLATGTGMTATGGNGVIILSQVTQAFQADCTAAALSNCANTGQFVFINRIVIGNASVTTSRFGTPPSSIVSSTGAIAAADYLTNNAAVATGFSTLINNAGITFTDGQIAYVTEVYFSTPQISFIPSAAAQGVYARAIF